MEVKDVTEGQKKDLIIASFIAMTELDDMGIFNKEEKDKMTDALDKAVHGGINEVYHKNGKLDYIINLTAKAAERIAIDLGMLDEDGNIKRNESSSSGPKWD